MLVGRAAAFRGHFWGRAGGDAAPAVARGGRGRLRRRPGRASGERGVDGNSLIFPAGREIVLFAATEAVNRAVFVAFLGNSRGGEQGVQRRRTANRFSRTGNSYCCIIEYKLT